MIDSRVSRVLEFSGLNKSGVFCGTSPIPLDYLINLAKFVPTAHPCAYRIGSKKCHTCRPKCYILLCITVP